MKRPMTMATVALGLSLVLLAGCGDNAGTGTGTSPTSSSSATTPSATPTSTATPTGAAALRGDWEISAEQYVLHLKDDGSFTEDFQGLTDFRTGTWKVEGDTVSLVGGEGDTDKGKIVGKTLVFTLGTATRI